MTVTYHAEERIKIRMGLGKSAFEKVATKALECGLKHKDVAGKLKRYLDKIYLDHGNANNMRIYNNKIFLFCGDILITVFDLPSEFRKTVEKIKKQKERSI
jgi:hypothetical protein